jgi:hypothetical protein
VTLFEVTTVLVVTVAGFIGSVADGVLSPGMGAVIDLLVEVTSVLDWVTEAAGCPVAAATGGSVSRSMGAYFASGRGGGFGCEHETRQSTRRRETIVFIF